MLRLRTSLLFLSFLVLFVGVPTASRAQRRGKDGRTTDAPPEIRRAMQEMWRRGSCLLSSVYKPAEREAALPNDLGGTPVLRPPVLRRQGRLFCYATDGRTIWAADDQKLYQVDAAAGKVRKEFDRRAGLPGEPIQSIAPAGESVWLATRAGLARLNVKTGRIAPAGGGLSFAMARLAAGPSGVWLVSDAGAYRLAPGETRWRKLPDFPGREQLAGQMRRGFWSAVWHRKMRVLMPSILATKDGLCVVCANHLLHFSAGKGRWREISREAWQAVASGRSVWGLTTRGAVRYDPASGKTERFEAGKGPASGRPVGMAVGKAAFFLATQPDYDNSAGRFVGGGISRLDLARGEWTVTADVDGTDVRFITAVLADGDEAWAACILYEKVSQRGAHPGMAHVKRWRPEADGLGLLHYRGGKWTLQKRKGLKTEQRWVMGQRGTVKQDFIGPETVEAMCRCGGRLWGVYRIVPQHYYAGYFISAGCLAERSDGRWQARFDVRTKELGLEGEQPKLMLISHSHGHRIVLADGHPIVLGMEDLAGRAWVISEGGLFAEDPGGGAFSPVLREAPRLYWRATAAAADPDCVWFGGDAGTISRFDRKTGRLDLLGVAEGRKIVRMVARGGGVRAATSRSDAVLPVSLADAARLPEGDVLDFDGKRWTAGSGQVAPQAIHYSFRGRSNYLYRGQKRVAFLKGVFRPIALCEDRAAGEVWLGTYEGVACVRLSPEGAE